MFSGWRTLGTFHNANFTIPSSYTSRKINKSLGHRFEIYEPDGLILSASKTETAFHKVLQHFQTYY